jgi:hypothetical protein
MALTAAVKAMSLEYWRLVGTALQAHLAERRMLVWQTPQGPKQLAFTGCNGKIVDAGHQAGLRRSTVQSEGGSGGRASSVLVFMVKLREITIESSCQ